MKLKFKINADMIVGLICMAIGAFFYFTQIEELPARSQTFPRIAFLLFIFLSALVVIQSILTSIKEEKSEKNEDTKKAGQARKADEIKSTLVVTLIIAGFIAIMYYVNYYVAAIFFIPCLMLYFRIRNWKLIGGITVVMTAGMYILFELLLKVPLHS